MSRPILLAFLLLVFIITSQYDWKQQVLTDVEASPSVSEKQQRISQREEAVKEKIILSQEKNIQRLNDLVKILREQLLECQSSNETLNSDTNVKILKLERKPILDD